MDYARLYMLKRLSESLTDEEKRILAGQDRESQHKEIMNELANIRKRSSFGVDFISNVAGNASWDAAVWLTRKILRLVR